nr:hypothetical protein [Tanacetum cinerariifolium]
METKDSISSCSDSEEQEMQRMQKRVTLLKESSMNGLNALRTNFQLLFKTNLFGSPIDHGFKREFERLFGEEHRTFIDTLLHNMDNLENQLIKETLHEKDSKSALSNMDKRVLREQQIHTLLYERKLMLQECKVQEVKAADASSRNTNNSGIVSDRGNEENVKLVNQISTHERRISQILKEKEQMKKDFKAQEDNEINRLIGLENQVKFLNNIVYKTSESVQTIHMLTPKPISYYTGLGLRSFAKPKYLEKAHLEKPCLYNVKYDKNDLENLFAPESKETIRLAKESRLKLCKDFVKSYDYTRKNSMYELFTPQTERSREQLFFANEVRKKDMEKSFQKQITYLVKRIEYFPTKASMSKSKQAFYHLMINIENMRSVVDLNWKNRLQNKWQNPITHDVKLLVKDMLIPLAHDNKSNASLFETHLKTEMFADLKYIQSLKK